MKKKNSSLMLTVELCFECCNCINSGDVHAILDTKFAGRLLRTTVGSLITVCHFSFMCDNKKNKWRRE